jgi:hypothetical protein
MSPFFRANRRSGSLDRGSTGWEPIQSGSSANWPSGSAVDDRACTAVTGDHENVWTALPAEIKQWWRQRAAMRLIHDGNGWKIGDAGSDRARVAWASEHDGHLSISLDTGSETKPSF